MESGDCVCQSLFVCSENYLYTYIYIKKRKELLYLNLKQEKKIKRKLEKAIT